MKTLNIAILATSLFLSTSITAFANDAVRIMTEFYKTADMRPFNAEKLREFYSDQHKNHDPGPNQKGTDKEESVNLFKSLALGSSDSFHDITYILPVGEDKALVRWKFKGTHDGNFFGMPATGNKIDIAGMELWETKDGKITGIWHVEELHKLFSQLTKK